MSIFASKGRGDGPSILKAVLGMVRGDKAWGGVEAARGRYVAGSRGVVVAVLSFHVGFAFGPHTGYLVLSSMSYRSKKSFQLIRGSAARGRRGGSIVS